MELQEKNENTTIGLHRPFNMPLKSLVWVCRFSKGYKQKKDHDFYLDFFLWMLAAISEHADSFDELNAEGIIRPQNAQTILCLIGSHPYVEVKEKIRSTLSERVTDDDKSIYSSYKNTSYYITLAKKINFIDNRGNLSLEGEELAKVRDYHFYELADKHKQIVFRALCPFFFDQLIVIAQGLRQWVNTLVLFKGVGTARKIYQEEIENLNLSERFKELIDRIEVFYNVEFKKRLKLEEQYDKIRSSYEQLQKKGLAEYGYVNLYDVKKNFRLSYESFNELLNSYYTAYRHIEIILFSNTVSSIDMRRRFLVDGNSVLKLRIIKKS